MFLARVHAVHHQLATTANIVDRIRENLDAASGLDNDIEAVGIVGLQLGILHRGILT